MITPRNKSGYLPSLDGWRAFAILGVLMTHDLPWRFGRFTNAGFKGFGGWGVELFFAISGLLICTRILEEEALVGRFRLKAFYVRRIFRIQPAATMYLTVIGILALCGVVHETLHYWLGSAFLYGNFLSYPPERTGEFFVAGHFWSLAVEEHFYILLSLLLFFVRKNRIGVFGCLIAVIYVVQKFFMLHLRMNGTGSFSLRTYWWILYLLVPSWFALLLRVPRLRTAADRFLHPWVAYLFTLVVVAGFRLRYSDWHEPYSTDIVRIFPVLYVVFSAWIIATMLHRRSLSTRLLELAPIRFLGRISYSLYLWHLLFFSRVYPNTHIASAPLLFLSERPLKYIASFGMALLSYFFIEKPLIRLGHRLAPPATPGHADTVSTSSTLVGPTPDRLGAPVFLGGR